MTPEETHFKVGGCVAELIRLLSDFANWGTGLIKGFATSGCGRIARTGDRVTSSLWIRENESAK